nr:twin-arginine translocation (Tat) [Bradyrhizobium elkanii]
MERRHFLKIALGAAAGVATFAATAQAAPMMPLSEDARRPSSPDAHPAVSTGDEVEKLKPEQVQWHGGHGHRGHGHGGHGHRRHWHPHRGWRHRHRRWHRRHWRRW